MVPIPGKRTRIEWTDSLDEDLRDMAAIVRARAYATSASLLPWMIVTKVFKGSKQSVLKHRLLKLERDPREKMYIDLLTDAWTQLYFEKRGQVKELPDPSPTQPTAMDGGLAMDYLRANIDKAYLRSQVNVPEEDATSEVPLPQTVEELHRLFRIKPQSQWKPCERWEPVHMPLNNIARQETFVNEAFSVSTEFSEDCIGSSDQPPHLIMRACEAIKVYRHQSFCVLYDLI